MFGSLRWFLFSVFPSLEVFSIATSLFDKTVSVSLSSEVNVSACSFSPLIFPFRRLNRPTNFPFLCLFLTKMVLSSSLGNSSSLSRSTDLSKSKSFSFLYNFINMDVLVFDFWLCVSRTAIFHCLLLAHLMTGRTICSVFQLRVPDCLLACH